MCGVSPAKSGLKRGVASFGLHRFPHCPYWRRGKKGLIFAMAEFQGTAGNFEREVLCSDVPVLVDFWATWCGPCRMLTPIVAQIAKEYEGKVSVARVNVDEEPVLAAQYQISAIPTLILFKNGKAVAQSVGVCPKSEIENMLNRA